MTDTQRRIILMLSDGDWHELFPQFSVNGIISAIRAGYARQDASGAIIGARFTITPKGEQAYRWMQ